MIDARSLVVSVDQSTFATKAIVFDTSMSIVTQASIEHKQHYPRAGWVEHDPEELYANTIAAIGEVAKCLGADKARVCCIAITNQRETAIVWDRSTGKPVCNAVVWQCQRGAELCNRLKEGGHAGQVKASTGLPLDPYFSASKISWILDNVPGARAKAQEGRLAFGTVDSWLVWKLTGGQVHATDPTNASRTMLMNLVTLDWDDALLELFRIPRSMVPSIQRSNHVFGATTAGGIFGELPITGVLGDSHAAFFGQCCFQPGQAKATYGTGTSIMMNIGAAPVESGRSLATSVGWAIDGRVDYVLEGNIHSSGDTIRWLRDGLGLLENASESERLALSVPDNNGVYLVPAFSGLGAPYWDNNARAAIVGMARNTTRAHVARAGLEAIAYQVSDLLATMRAEAGIPLTELRVDGGASTNRFLVQFQADILGVPVAQSAQPEASALGAAMMAGLSMGVWKDLSSMSSARSRPTIYRESMDPAVRARLIAGWREAVARVLSITGS
ncbi:MAG TPA: glycerol kinase GlpK [Spirochaetia bacterium]|nr:glycerol kinase GlpK [Spirochaetia bacterium]